MSRSGTSLNIAQQLRKTTQLAALEDGLRGLDKKQPGNSYTSKVKIGQKYNIIGFISSGTYGRVYKAVEKNPKGDPSSPVGTSPPKELYAIKKFKPEKEGDNVQYTGLSQSAIREMSLCTELTHPNLVHLAEIILEDKCVFMVFEYCEHDLLQIIHHHTQPTRRAIPATMIKSILFQLLNGLFYLHQNWVIHRDLKPANIMVTSSGHVRIGDLGLARLFHKPLSSLYSGDKVVVTIWYRSPDLLLGARHYTPSIDLWAVGCIFAELLSLRPIFKGEETKMDSKKTVPFQRNQMGKIVEILGMPRRENWKGLVDMPEYPQLQSLIVSRGGIPGGLYPSSNSMNRGLGNNGSGLEAWYNNCLKHASYPSDKSPGQRGFQLLSELFEYDPEQRLTAEQALHHEYFRNADEGLHHGKIWVSNNCFEGLNEVYPHRRVSTETNDIGTGSLPGTKRGGLPDDSLLPAAKRR
ncbi:CMGC/CDK/CDK8 protein kinase [Cladophialophora yegresii CBS 114405]|uniref:Serine/threonine-protein kinase SSN3 n=1 Tax=Cladophialophora yegresii CBS 114405 TaxID=1182544 RepID=W9WBK7_9EURO|nr:CMGC/CDK/CDK8 protein kinase [Cladophialophora yegresii CBS 114405]EXJ65502.1 CMGC/CDK/CDK8 protein kinase [Cladophialophora yegresii CBS 114405]